MDGVVKHEEPHAAVEQPAASADPRDDPVADTSPATTPDIEPPSETAPAINASIEPRYNVTWRGSSVRIAFEDAVASARLQLDDRDWSVLVEDRNVSIGFLPSDREMVLEVDVGGMHVDVNITSSPEPAWPLATEARIHPGTWIITGNTLCTLGFILLDARNETLYALTAGHCVDDAEPSADGRVEVRFSKERDLLGHVAVLPMQDQPYGADWTLIEILPSLRGEVSPEVEALGFPGDLREARRPVQRGDALCWVGNSDFGTLWGAMDMPTRTRCGHLLDTGQLGPDAHPGSPAYIHFSGAVWQGDSGGPIVLSESMVPTALIIGGFGVANTGTALCPILGHLATEGFHLWPAASSPQGPAMLPPVPAPDPWHLEPYDPSCRSQAPPSLPWPIDG